MKTSIQSELTVANRRRPARGGQAMVEFALVLPIFVVLIMAIIDFSYYLFVMVSVNQATRAGARQAAMNQVDCTTIKSTVRNSAVGIVLDTSSISVVTLARDASLTGEPPTATVSVNHAHRMFASSLWQFSTLPVRSSFKTIVTTFAGSETVTFPSASGGTCP